jgi:WD40 repeat protein
MAEDPRTGNAIIPEDKNRELSLSSEIVSRGLGLVAKIENQRDIKKYKQPIRYFVGFHAPQCCMDFSRNGEFALITRYGHLYNNPEFENPELTVWEVANGNTRVLSAKEHGLALRYVYSVALSHSGDFALVGYDDGSIVCWDVKNDLILHEFIGNPKYGELEEGAKQDCSVRSVLFSPDNQYFAEGNHLHARIRSIESGVEIQQLNKRIDFYNQMAFSYEGGKLLVGSLPDFSTLIEVGGKQESLSFGGPSDAIAAVSIFPDRQKLITMDWYGVLTIWNAMSGDKISQWSHAKSPIRGWNSVAVSQNGQRIISGGSDTYMRLWTLDGQEICEYPHNTRVVKVAFLLDGQQALSSCWDGSVYLWELLD